MRRVAEFVEEEEGEAAIEYGLIASLVVLAILGAVTLVADNVNAMWSTIAQHI